jgi:hypothetical protein
MVTTSEAKIVLLGEVIKKIHAVIETGNMDRISPYDIGKLDQTVDNISKISKGDSTVI